MIIRRTPVPLGCLLAGLLAADAAASPGPAAAEGEPRTKKDERLAAKRDRGDPAEAARARKRWREQLDRRIGKPPPALIAVHNAWTHEIVVVDADPRSNGSAISSEEASRFLRCHFTNRSTEMDPRLFGTVVAAARHFKARRVDVISGFRSPKYNLMLRKKGRRVARESRHTLGQAVDFRVRGVAAGRLLRWARSRKIGGVGYYPTSGFVHLDVGPIRAWSAR